MNRIWMRMKEKQIQETGIMAVFALASGWLLASLLMQIGEDSRFFTLSAIAEIGTGKLILFSLLYGAVIFAIGCFLKRKWIPTACFTVCVVLYGFTACLKSQDLNVALGFGGVTLLVWLLVISKKQAWLERIRTNGRRFYLFCGIGAFLWVGLVGSLVVLRYLDLRTPCFDFGIFSQMYYYMRKTGLPLTTCEREGLLSHFAVHVSPSLYLLLPVYAIFPSQITILILQVLVVGSGVIPLWKLGKQKGMANGICFGLCIVYLLYPATTGGLFYDFHENKLLLPLLLWMLYALESEKTVLFAVMTVLVLGVKEDAAIYVACVALYMIFGKKKWKSGLATLITSIAWFFAVFYYLQTYGDGAMIGRYSNFILNGGGIGSMITNILKNPAYLIEQCFTEEKILFMLYMLAPLLGILFWTKKISRYLLLIPFLVINLMSNNGYQHSIFYQYTYGVTALFFFLTVLELQPRPRTEQKKILISMGLVSLMLFTAVISQKLYYGEVYANERETLDTIKENLDRIPADASVESTTYLLSYLSHRDVIYRMTEGNAQNVEAYVFDLRYDEFRNLLDRREDALIKNGYQQISENPELVVIYYKKAANGE